MSGIGEKERRTQQRVARLFVDELGYEHLGDLSDGDNHNVIEWQLEHFLWAYQGYAEREDGDTLMRRAIAEFVKAAGNTGMNLYDRNREVYRLLRYGVKVKPDVGRQSGSSTGRIPRRTASPSPRRSRSSRPTPGRTASGRTSSSTSTASPWACSS